VDGSRAQYTDFSVPPVSLTSKLADASDSCKQQQQSDEKDVSSNVSHRNVMNGEESEDVDIKFEEERDDDGPLFHEVASLLYNVDQEMFRGEDVQHVDTDALSNTMDNIVAENDKVCVKIEKGNEVITSPLYNQGYTMLRSVGVHQQVGDGERMCDSNDKSHKCNICNSTFSRTSNLNQHKHAIHSGINRFNCHICNQSFEHHSDLAMHKCIFHSNNKPYICDVCQMAFSSASGLESHKNVHSGTVNRLSCDTCNKTFRQLNILTMHKHTHESSKRYVCHVCKMAYHYPSSLKRHQASHNKLFRCDICDDTFISRHYLLAHKRNHDKPDLSSMHHGVGMFPCDLCDKSFSLNYLYTHRRLHTGEKPYVCNICHKAFAQSSVLSSHKATHTDVKQFSCKTCHKAYKHNESLMRHRREVHHKGRKKRIHNDVKSFSCDTCVQGFKRHFNKHTCTDSHTGDRPYVCKQCNMSFADVAIFNIHRNVHLNSV